MIGAVCTNYILFHPIVTIRAFGWRVIFRAIFEHQGDNFLPCSKETGSLMRRPHRNSPIAFAS